MSAGEGLTTPEQPGVRRGSSTPMDLVGFSTDDRRLSDRVAGFIRQLIVSGELAPGARIREVEIAERLGVSRAPVREAILQLSRESLLETQPHRGATVRSINEHMLREIAEVRVLLEGYVAADFSRRRDHPGIALLGQRLEMMRQAAQAEDHASLAAAHIDFHRTFLEHADNRVLQNLLSSLWGQSTTFLQVIHGRYIKGDLQEIVVARHEELLDAILSGDAEAVARSMASHIGVPRGEVPPSFGSEAGT